MKEENENQKLTPHRTKVQYFIDRLLCTHWSVIIRIDFMPLHFGSGLAMHKYS